MESRWGQKDNMLWFPLLPDVALWCIVLLFAKWKKTSKVDTAI